MQKVSICTTDYGVILDRLTARDREMDALLHEHGEAVIREVALRICTEQETIGKRLLSLIDDRINYSARVRKIATPA